MLSRLIKERLRRFGIDVRRYDPVSVADHCRNAVLSSLGVDLAIDVGANEGQFGTKLRMAGYSGRIVSVEPSSVAFERLSQLALLDPEWEVHQMALADSEGMVELNIAGNSLSSSLLPMEDAHVAAAPQSAYVGKEVVRCTRLDSFLVNEVPGNSSSIFIKLDVQGAEHKILAACDDLLPPELTCLEVEISLVPLYSGASTLLEMLAFLSGRGFSLVGVDPAFIDDRSGRVLQIDGLFIREPSEQDAPAEDGLVGWRA